MEDDWKAADMPSLRKTKYRTCNRICCRHALCLGLMSQKIRGGNGKRRHARTFRSHVLRCSFLHRNLVIIISQVCRVVKIKHFQGRKVNSRRHDLESKEEDEMCKKWLATCVQHLQYPLTKLCGFMSIDAVKNQRVRSVDSCTNIQHSHDHTRMHQAIFM